MSGRREGEKEGEGEDGNENRRGRHGEGRWVCMTVSKMTRKPVRLACVHYYDRRR